MSTFRNISIAMSILLIIYSADCSSPDEKSVESKEKNSESTENKSDEKDLGTISPAEMEKLKEEIIEIQEKNAKKFGLDLRNTPEEVETFLKAEEKEYGKELPEKVEESVTDAGDLENFVHFVELFDKIELENSDKDEEVVEKSPEQMKEMKEELFELTNKGSEKYDLPPISREDFNEVWKQKEEVYGKYFPYKVEKFIKFLETDESIEEIATTVKEVSEVMTEESSLVTEPPKEEPPKDTFVVRSTKGKICILAKFHVFFTIIYTAKESEQKVEVGVPSSSHAIGKCGGSSRSLQISWEYFIFSLIFNKTSEDSWSATSIEFSYDTSEPLFDEAVNRGKITARSQKVNLFETPLGSSYFCAGQEVIPLYHKDNQVATAHMNEIHIQPYEVEDGKFSTNYHCNQVVIDGPDEEPFVQDETVPLAVGCTLALITLLILVGFSVHRAYNAAKVDYNTME